MLTFLSFGLSAIILTLSGNFIVALILRRKSIPLSLALGLPVGALLNVLLIVILAVANIPLRGVTIILPLAMIALITGYMVFTMPKKERVHHHQISTSKTIIEKILIVLSLLIISATVIYSFAHAVMLPTFQYDSATNWTMRSKISFIDQKIAFDPVEDRGMAKPQYPFLIHALQITANELSKTWNDQASESILWLLSLSTFVALYLVLREKVSVTYALSTIAGILSIPLLSLHLGQGYGDNVLAQYFLLSLLFLHEACDEKSDDQKGYLLLSAIFISASVWTKSEGTFFGLVPWLIIGCGILLRKSGMRKYIILSSGLTLALSLPWHVFRIANHLLLTPHQSDATIEFHTEALPEVLRGLFDRGSFGVLWYAVLIGTIIIGIDCVQKRKFPVHQLSGLIIGYIVFIEFLIVYIATPNVRFLLNAESFYRQMMIPLAMIILSLSLAIREQLLQKKTTLASFASHNPLADTPSQTSASPSLPS